MSEGGGEVGEERVTPDVRGRCLGMRLRRQEIRSRSRGLEEEMRRSLDAFVCEVE
jgi:hypothetical protein